MNKLTAKLKKQGGFTLVEMLIVVAIIAILVAVSIPLVSTALEKSREATDDANKRSFKAELVICYLSGTVDGTDTVKKDASGNATNAFEVGEVYVFNAVEGSIIKNGTNTDAISVDDGKFTVNSVEYEAYGQGTDDGNDEEPHQGKILYGKVNSNGQVTMGWGKDQAESKVTADESTT